MLGLTIREAQQRRLKRIGNQGEKIEKDEIRKSKKKGTITGEVNEDEFAICVDCEEFDTQLL